MYLRRPSVRLRLAFLAVLVSLGAAAAAEAKIPRLCFLTFDPGTLQHRSSAYDGFFDGLRERGYVNGRNIDIVYLSADSNGGGYPALIEQCLNLQAGRHRGHDHTGGTVAEKRDPYRADRHGRLGRSGGGRCCRQPGAALRETSPVRR
ncbi:MAG TPA: hypothetical protein VFQ82_09715 [Stellaceae bacterium]|nr:hypothetical protein [Stellaceae bacterium]